MLYLGLKVAGGIYLIYLAVRIWLGSTSPIEVRTGGDGRLNFFTSFGFGLATQLSNPKIVAVFGAVFAALLPADPPLWMDLALPPLIFIQETTWYALVAISFSSSRPRALYLKARTWIDRAAGAVIGILGVRLILEAR